MRLLNFMIFVTLRGGIIARTIMADNNDLFQFDDFSGVENSFTTLLTLTASPPMTNLLPPVPPMIQPHFPTLPTPII